MPNLGQLASTSDEQLMRDWQELDEAFCEQTEEQAKTDIYEYQQTIEDELNKRGWYLDCNGIYWNREGCK